MITTGYDGQGQLPASPIEDLQTSEQQALVLFPEQLVSVILTEIWHKISIGCDDLTHMHPPTDDGYDSSNCIQLSSQSNATKPSSFLTTATISLHDIQQAIDYTAQNIDNILDAFHII